MLSFALALLLIPAGRMHGIGAGNAPKWAFFASGLKDAAYVILAMTFGIASMLFWHTPYMLIGGAIAAWGLSLGHGNFYEMLGAQDGIGTPPSAPEKLEKYFARPVWNYFSALPITAPEYSFWCMAVKWFVVGAAIPPVGIALAIFAPSAYVLSFAYDKSSAAAEWAVTIFAAALLLPIFGGLYGGW